MADALQQERPQAGSASMPLDWHWLFILGLAIVGVFVGRLLAHLPLRQAAVGADRYFVGQLARTTHPSRSKSTQQVVAVPVPPPSSVALPKVSAGPAPLPAGMVLAYFYDPSASTQRAAQDLKGYLSKISGIIPSWYSINAGGAIAGTTDQAVLQLAKSHALYTFALIRGPSQGGPQTLNSLLMNPAHQAAAIHNIAKLLSQNGFDGVNLDWEGIPPQDRQQFSDFVRQLATVLHQQGRYLTLSIPAETSTNPNNSWSGAYDYQALGQSADLLMIMAYDQHYPGSVPGPVAASSWVSQVLQYAIHQVSPSKIVLGVPGYGYNWTGTGSGTAVTYAQAKALAKQYAPGNHQNHFQYVQNGVVHSVWFENAHSLLSKLDLVMGYELRGIALWRLGIEDPQLWGFLNN